ncbi:sensory histidine kinase CreC [Salmonella enterica subsp. enterica serovar Kentucky str. 5349]|nr:sensory histidine kinase CreC [Salmonella enterica subsp. enterica serovar Kentucky str. 5349]
MRIGMRLLLGYFLIVAVAAVFVLSIFVQEIKPGVRRATEGTLIDTATISFPATRLTASWRRHSPNCNIARFAPISAGSSKCAMNTMST